MALARTHASRHKVEQRRRSVCTFGQRVPNSGRTRLIIECDLKGARMGAVLHMAMPTRTRTSVPQSTAVWFPDECARTFSKDRVRLSCIEVQSSERRSFFSAHAIATKRKVKGADCRWHPPFGYHQRRPVTHGCRRTMQVKDYGAACMHCICR